MDWSRKKSFTVEVLVSSAISLLVWVMDCYIERRRDK